MKISLAKLIFALSAVRLLPHLLAFNLLLSRNGVREDLDRWSKIYFSTRTTNKNINFLRLMTLYPEYRNLFYFRIGAIGKILAIICKPMPMLFISTSRVGPGLFIQHGFSTIISAESIGNNCWINQQVTIGFAMGGGQPNILDNVIINAGAKIIGAVTIGNNSIIGANAVVVKNVPANVTVVGVPGRIVRRNGVRVDEPL
jgi:serine O-acetyltransferase